MKQPGRAGQYAPQPQGYSAFIPIRLPPNPPVVMDNEMLALISQADRAMGRLDGSIQTLLSPNLFVFMYVRKEAVLSKPDRGYAKLAQRRYRSRGRRYSARPGRATSARGHQLRARDEFWPEAPEGTARFGAAHQGNPPAAVERCARRRAPARRVAQHPELDRPGRLHAERGKFCSAPANSVPDVLADLERFIHSDDPMPLLVKIGLAHAQFETIHPFSDGNGRVGRLLIAFLLCERKILQKPVLYISHYFPPPS